MQIINTEKISLSKVEDEAWDVMVMCLSNIIEASKDPEILKYANETLNGFNELCMFLEERK